MTPATLTFVCTGGARDAVARHLDPVVRAWPDARAPELRVVRTGRALDEAPGVVLIVAGADETSRSMRRLVDRLIELDAAAVIVCEQVEDWRERLQAEGIIFTGPGTAPATLAAMLFALSQRQPVVERLSGELRVARTAHGGLSGEIDKMHRELHLASMVQRAFIPRTPPHAEELDFAWVFRPAGYVSGDIFDIRPLDDRRWMFFLADVVGHGVPAALLTMIVARGLAISERQNRSPGEILLGLNREMCDNPEGPQRFATAVYGVIDARTLEVTLAAAGHPPPLVFGPEGHEKIEADGPLLGVFEDATFEERSFRLKLGQTLLLYTDGFELAFPGPNPDESDLNRPTLHYVDHLAHVARGWDRNTCDLSRSMERLEELLDQQAGSLNRADDVTALAIAPKVRAALAA